MNFKLVSDFKPSGDQPQAIEQLTENISNGQKHSVLLGVTGSGKTYTVANVIEKINKPVLVLSHNKTLARQLYSEFKAFFPENAVEYYISYYDYYQPEAYLPSTDTFIEKDLSINDQIEKMRLSTTTTLLSGRRDVIVVASVSCIYGIGNPKSFHESRINVRQGQTISRNMLLYSFISALYTRTEVEFKAGDFRVLGDFVDIFPAYADIAYRIEFFDDEIEKIFSLDPKTGQRIEEVESITIFPANLFVTSKDSINKAIRMIQDDLTVQYNYFLENGQPLEAARLKQRVEFDLEMMKEVGYCSGIENYSRYFDMREPGSRPFCLLDYFDDDFLMVIDESHVTLPQIRAMQGGDFSRKDNLVKYGFRLPAAIDNRPLSFTEFEALVNQVLYISATPAEYELNKVEGVVVEQIVRPTGVLDPYIELQKCDFQIEKLVSEIMVRRRMGDKILVTTLTKRMAEELTKYLASINIPCNYIHSEVDTLKRLEILDQFRDNEFDVLIGVNLLREGLDLPEVSLVAILDADKEGFLRSERSLTQVAGRAARNINGKVIMFADTLTDSIKRTMYETARRRAKQQKYNEENNIEPTQIVKLTKNSISAENFKSSKKVTYDLSSSDKSIAADPVIEYMAQSNIDKAIEYAKKQMEEAAEKLDFHEAAKYRDEMYRLQKQKENNKQTVK